MTIRSWIDERGVRRCDRTERTNLPRAATILMIGGSSSVIAQAGDVVYLDEESPFFVGVHLDEHKS